MVSRKYDDASRHPMIAPGDPSLLQEHKNPIARSKEFQNLFDASFGGAIFPDGSKFYKSQAPLYISARQWIVDEDFVCNNESTKYEEYLDSLFWNEKNKKRLAFIVGGVGTGKSTFMDYYLRCYCPTESKHKARFSEKLPIIINAKGKHSDGDLIKSFYQQACSAILDRCHKVGIHPDFNGQAIDPKSDPEGWTISTLRHFRSVIDSDETSTVVPFRYVVIAIDNLDQSPLEVQKRAISLVRDWLTPDYGILPWRVYIPMWPQTLSKLLNSLGQPFRRDEFEEIPLGTVEYSEIINSRKTKAVNGMKYSGIVNVPVTEDIVDGDVVVSRSISNENCVRFIEDTYEFISRLFGKQIENICNYDLRREIQVWDNLFSSMSLFFSWRETKKRQKWIYSTQRVPHEIINSAMTGRTTQYNSAKARIENLYDCGEFSLLCGLHATVLLRNTTTAEVDKGRVTRVLMSAGHHEFDIQRTLDRLFEANMYHEIARDNFGTAFVIHHSTANAYLDLAMHPAYVENCALVTPVKSDYRKDMNVTTTINSDQFVTRLKSTFAFISAIKDDEVNLRNATLNRLLEMSDPERQKELEIINTVKWPVFWKAIASRYKERLDNLRQRRLFPDAPWNQLIDTNTLFQSMDKSPDHWSY